MKNHSAFPAALPASHPYMVQVGDTALAGTTSTPPPAPAAAAAPTETKSLITKTQGIFAALSKQTNDPDLATAFEKLTKEWSVN